MKCATFVSPDALVTTDRGRKPMSEIFPGERVLTRKGELRRVAEVLTKEVDSICQARDAKGTSLDTTADGCFLTTPWYNDNPERHTWETLDKILPRNSSFVCFNGECFLGVPGYKQLPKQVPKTKLYSLAVRDADNFIASGFVVRARQETASQEEILAFIRNFKGAETTFLTGCCYWFAFILQERFGGQMLYYPAPGHFVQEIGGCLYDVTGDVTQAFANEHPPVIWKDVPGSDISWYRYVLNDCVDKQERPEC